MIKGYITGIYENLSEVNKETFRKCREDCDYLIVGLFSDDFSYRLTNVPLVCDYETRKNNLLETKLVDEVVLVDWDNISKEVSVKQFGYNVCFVGFDYKNASIKNKDITLNQFEEDQKCLENVGAKMMVLDSDIDSELIQSDKYSLMIIEEQMYLKESHRILMLLLEEFDRVCRKHGLRYFMNCGSLIGAVRHDALIPWDDDADVAMFREDFDKLKKIATEEWNGITYELVDYDQLGKSVFHDFMCRFMYKAEDLPSGLFNISKSKMREDLVNKFCMDIYVLDNAVDDEKKHNRQMLTIRGLYGLAMGHRATFDNSDYAGQKTRIKSYVRILSSVGKIIPLKCIFKMYEKTRKRYDKKDTKLCYESNGFIMNLHWRYDKTLLGNGTYLKVYGKDIMVPENYDGYLNAHGYHNYMNYPPANVRKPSHSVNSEKIMYIMD